MAGAGRRTFTPGEVLTASNVMNYLQDQAVMNFAGTAARGSAIGTAVSEGMVSYLADTNSVEVYKSNGVAAWEPVNLVQSPNILINGGFDIWQRGTSGFTSGYFADRWFLNGANSGSRSTDVPSSDFSYSASATNTSSAYAGITQRIESANAKQIVGKYVTVSGWFKRTGTTAGGTININMDYANATDNFSGTTYVASVTWAASTPSTSWTKYSATFSVVAPSGVGNGVQFSFTHNGSAGNNLGGLWAGLQIEVGLTPTAFRRNANSVQGELAVCQRYYYRVVTTEAYGTIGFGTAIASNQATIFVKNPVTMRAIPTASESANIGIWDGVTIVGITTIVLRSGHSSLENSVFLVTVPANPLPQYRPYFLLGSNNTAGYLGISAEL